MKKIISFFIIYACLLLPLTGFSDTVFLKKGARWDVGETWEEDGQIKFELYGSIVGFPKEDVLKVEKSKKIQVSPEKDKTEKTVFKEESSESCYNLGYRFGLCATKAMHGIPCKPENDIVIPERCRNRNETNQGIKAGVKVVRDGLNYNTKKSTSSSSLNMLITPINVLNSRLKGKTKSEVRRLVGSPDRIEVFAGNKCWIYGNTYSSRDRGIVFVGDKVLTVTFY